MARSPWVRAPERISHCFCVSESDGGGSGRHQEREEVCFMAVLSQEWKK